jgi:Ulp1 family protease
MCSRINSSGGDLDFFHSSGVTSGASCIIRAGHEKKSNKKESSDKETAAKTKQKKERKKEHYVTLL